MLIDFEIKQYFHRDLTYFMENLLVLEYPHGIGNLLRDIGNKGILEIKL